MIKDTQLYQQIQDELKSDCIKFTTGTNDYFNWIIHVTTEPNQRLMDLYLQIPEDQSSLWFEYIEDEILSTICEVKSTVDF